MLGYQNQEKIKTNGSRTDAADINLESGATEDGMREPWGHTKRHR